MSAFRRRPYRRGDRVNWVGGRGTESESYEKILSETCPQCYVRMKYIEAKINNFKCLLCGFEPQKPDIVEGGK